MTSDRGVVYVEHGTQELPVDEPLGTLEPVAHFNGAMPTGVTVSHQGRIFVNFPKWGDDVPFTVAEIRAGKPVAYPDEAINRTNLDDPAAALVSVHVVFTPDDRLWIFDTGSPMFQPTEYGGPKLICVDLATDRVVKKILFPQDVALPTTYLNDVRFDLRRGTEGMAFITDSADKGANGIIVVDLASGKSWRRLHDHPSTKAEELPTFRWLKGDCSWSISRTGQLSRALASERMGLRSVPMARVCTTVHLVADGSTA